MNWLNVEVFIAHQFVASLLIRTRFNAKTQKMSNTECAILLATCKAERLAEVDAFLKSGNKPFLDEVKIYQETQRDGIKLRQLPCDSETLQHSLESHYWKEN